MGVEPKIGVFTPQIIHSNRVFHYKPSILGENPLFLETPIFCRPSNLCTEVEAMRSNTIDGDSHIILGGLGQVAVVDLEFNLCCGLLQLKKLCAIYVHTYIPTLHYTTLHYITLLYIRLH